MSGYGGPDDDAMNALAFIENHVDLIRSKLPTGESLQYCLECGAEIPKARRDALPGVKTCIPCQTELDKVKINIKTVTYML
jgi:phage/conjugal plasmid C-4 type zinc finger TraR family protein